MQPELEVSDSAFHEALEGWANNHSSGNQPERTEEPSGQRPEIYQPRASGLDTTSEARCVEESVALGRVSGQCGGLKARDIVQP